METVLHFRFQDSVCGIRDVLICDTIQRIGYSDLLRFCDVCLAYEPSNPYMDYIIKDRFRVTRDSMQVGGIESLGGKIFVVIPSGINHFTTWPITDMIRTYQYNPVLDGVSMIVVDIDMVEPHLRIDTINALGSL